MSAPTPSTPKETPSSASKAATTASDDGKDGGTPASARAPPAESSPPSSSGEVERLRSALWGVNVRAAVWRRRAGEWEDRTDRERAHASALEALLGGGGEDGAGGRGRRTGAASAAPRAKRAGEADRGYDSSGSTETESDASGGGADVVDAEEYEGEDESDEEKEKKKKNKKSDKERKEEKKKRRGRASVGGGGGEDRKWQLRFAELKKFKARHGHCDARDGVLGTWVNAQRNEYAKYLAGEEESALTEGMVSKLEGLGFTWDKRDERWNARFRELKEFYDEHWHCNVPQHANSRLKLWADEQRREYKHQREGKESTLTPERKKKLDTLQFVWDRWYSDFERLKEFREEEGHCDVPSSEPVLFRWVSTQRSKRDSLPKERRKALDSLGFIWDKASKLKAEREQKWKDMLEKLKKFKEEHGHLDVPADAGELKKWVTAQHNYLNQFERGHRSSINEERKRALQEIGFECKLKRKRGTPERERRRETPPRSSKRPKKEEHEGEGKGTDE